MMENVEVLFNEKRKVIEKRAYSFNEIIEMAIGDYNDLKNVYTIVAKTSSLETKGSRYLFPVGSSLKVDNGMMIMVRVFERCKGNHERML